jgi:uncharacterized heparinase superfamily protein
MFKFLRLWRTLRYLRPVQIYGRIWFRLSRPRVDLSPAPPLRLRRGTWKKPAERRVTLIGPDVFCFLNEIGSIADHGWDDGTKAKLWRYNQHYFDDLNAIGATFRLGWHKALMADWISANPPGRGSGWEPYPTSLRIVNWIKWAQAGHDLDYAARQSLAVQTRWLAQRLEIHLLGNHLFTNAKALVFSGLFFDGTEADQWLGQGIQILKREISEQILPDGGQFELSPMYHSQALEDMLDLVNVLEAYSMEDLAPPWREFVPSMLQWLHVMCHPDQNLAFFNDTALWIAPDKTQLIAYASRLQLYDQSTLPALKHLVSSGYVRMALGQFTILADLARIGPDYLPGHAHADTLSFELSCGNQRVFVNSGTSEYGLGPERLRQRGTAAHNTVIIEDQNSSEVWSGFRVGRRARPLAVQVQVDGRGTLCAQASHDGYRHLRGQPIVSRRFELDVNQVRITDTVNEYVKAESRFHLHPLINIELTINNCVLLTLPNKLQLRVLCEGGPIRLENATWHPEFGISIPNQCLVLPLAAGRAIFSMEII